MMKRVVRQLKLAAGLFLCLAVFHLEAVSMPQREVFQEELSGGFVVLAENVSGAELVNLGLLVKSGSASEKEFLGAGITHLLEHLIFKGEGEKALASVVGRAGGTSNAYTSRDFTYFTVTVPRSEWKHVLPVLLQAVYQPGFTEDDFLKEREVVLREIARQDDEPDATASRALWETAFLVHPYRFPIGGWPQLLKNLTYQDLCAYHRQTYVPARSILSVAGEVKVEEVVLVCEQFLSGVSPGKPGEVALPAEPLPVSLRRKTIKFPTELAYLHLAAQITCLAHPDSVGLDLLAIVLGQGRNSRLYRRLIEKGLASSVSAFAYTPAQPGLFVVRCVCRPEQLPVCEKIIVEEMDKLSHGCTRKELSQAVNQLRHELLFSLQTVDNRAAELAQNYWLTGNPLYSEEYLQRLEKTGLSDLRRIAKTYLRPERLTIITLTGEKAGQATDKTTEPGRSSRATRVQQEKLASGLPLLLYQDERLPIVTISAFFKGGQLWEKKETSGLFPILANLLTCGTRRYNSRTIAELVASWSGELTAYAGNNSFGVTLSVAAEHWSTALELMAQIIQQPAFPEEELERVRKQVLASLTAREENAMTVAGDLLRQEIFGQHPYGLRPDGTRESVTAITRDDLLKTYRQFSGGNNLVLTVFGAINPERVVSQASRLFSHLPSASLREVPEFVPEVRPATRTVTVPRKEAAVMIGYPGLSVASLERSCLEIIAEYFNDQDGALFQRLREREPLVYACGFSYFLGLQPGLMFFYAQCHPEKVSRVLEIIKEEAEGLSRQEISGEELVRLKRKVMGNRMRARETISDKARESGLSVLYGLGIDFEEKLESLIQKVQPKDIQTFCQKYLAQQNARTVIVKPEAAPSGP
ncbi:MAG TPA: pitrilysin family protein [bacterium]|nr:pitrilysin family protein [bacterium]